MQNWKKVGPVTVWDTTKQVGERFASLDTLVLSRRFGGISERLGDQSHLDKLQKGIYSGPYRYLIRDECGLIIPLWKVEERATQLSIFKRWRNPWRRPADYVFRRDPVPHTRCFRGGNSYFRNVGTFAERRDNDFCNDHDEDAKFYGVRSRAARTTGNLPEPWDDILRTDYRNNNWKESRKTQWKARK